MRLVVMYAFTPVSEYVREPGYVASPLIADLKYYITNYVVIADLSVRLIIVQVWWALVGS